MAEAKPSILGRLADDDRVLRALARAGERARRIDAFYAKLNEELPLRADGNATSSRDGDRSEAA